MTDHKIGQRLVRKLSHLANDEDVGEPGGEVVACAILDVHHVERARVTLPVGDHTNTPQVSTTSHHAQVSWRKQKARNHVRIFRHQKYTSAGSICEKNLPVSNLMKSVILPESRSMRMVSLTLIRGSG